MSETENLAIPVSMAGKSLPDVNIIVRDRQSPGSPMFAFAVYSQNPDYHKMVIDDWLRAGQTALERWAAMHNHTIDIRPEHLRPLNVMGEVK